MLSLNCHALATIQSFDATKQTVTATVNYKKSYLQAGTDGVYKQVAVDYPLLLDVPIYIMGGGESVITFPIQTGDTCSILFNDRDIDNWIQSGQIVPPASGRLHSMSDGIALIGVRSAQNPVVNYDTDHAQLSWGETRLGVSADKILATNAAGKTLNDVLQDLVAQIQLITVICAAPSSPSGVPVNAAAFAAIATEISALLE